ncbi:MAG: chromatin modification- protein VID21 [Thelocarpon impressellum]|nr:MAG: chromatin modification- protein VID21 [Thelocarpon impressellum]
MTLDVVREGILRSKRDELSSSVLSRKRKLRELYAVARSAEPVPPHPGLAVAAAPDDAEARFLDANDILSGRYFDESTLPTRRQYVLSLDTRSTKPQSSVPNSDVTASPPRFVRKATEDAASGGQVVGRENGDDRAAVSSRPSPTPPTESPRRSGRANRGSLATTAGNTLGPPTLKSSKETQTASSDREGLPVLGEDRTSGPTDNGRFGPGFNSPKGSPGVDPAGPVPPSAEDVAALPGPTPTLGAVSSAARGAATVHLPPKEQQERHVGADRETQTRHNGVAEALKATPGPNGAVASPLKPAQQPPGSASSAQAPVPDFVSSPSSTAGPCSINTPGVNVSSADTSPDQDPAADEVDALASTAPPELAPSEAERIQKAEHDSLLRSQMKIAREDALQKSPSTPDAQLHLEEERARLENTADASPDATRVHATGSPASRQVQKAAIIQSAAQVAQDMAEDEEDEVIGVPTPEDDTLLVRADHTPRAPINGIRASAPRTPQDLPLFTSPPRPGGPRPPAIPGHAPLVQRAERPMSGEMVASPEKTSLSPAKQTPSGENVMMRDAPLLATPVKTHPTPSMQSPPERMTTRVSSGAIRHKSVSEILGETPKPSLSTQAAIEKCSADSSLTGPFTAIGPTHDASALLARSRDNERRDKDRSKLSTVVFAKQQPPKKLESLKRLSMAPFGMAHRPRQEEQDYLLPLFVAQASLLPRASSLGSLVATARKTMTTSEHYVQFHEHQDCLILKRIYQLQYANKWSLRQIERTAEPSRQATHWDALLDHMKWMRTDFREEKKWKLTAAKNMAMWCSVWVASDPEERAALQVQSRPPRPAVKSGSREGEMPDGHVRSEAREPSQPTPDLEPSGPDDSPSDSPDDEVPRLDLYNAVAPAALFSLPADGVAFTIDKTPASDNLLHELPLYEPGKDASDTGLSTLFPSPDAAWKTPMVPLSKFATGKMVAKEEEPPRKRSRFDYEEDEEDSAYLARSNGMASAFGFSAIPQVARYELAPEQNDVALFNPENKHIRDRIHAGHAFRPPSEHAMPSQAFFEARHSSQWVWTEDDELRALVKEYSYNWSLIASNLSSRSTFSSAAERRTPWECFERWVSLEGLPADMQKTPYFRTYHGRLEAAQRHLMSQAQLPQQQQQQAPAPQGQGSNPATPVRRRTSQPVRVERRKNTKYLTIIDAMRKLAKKRETSIQKQQHAAGLAAMRKANVEATQPRAAVHTPQDFSRMKHEREVKIQEKLQEKLQERAEAYRQSMAAQQKTALAQRSVQQINQQHGLVNGASHHANGFVAAPANVAGASPLPNGHGQGMPPAQARLQNPMQAHVNGMQNHGNGGMPPGMNGGNVPAAAKGMPQAQMQGNMQGHHRPQQPMQQDVRLLMMESNRIQQEQRRFLQQQQQQQGHHQYPNQQAHGQAGPSSSPNMGSVNINGFGGQGAMQTNPAMLAAIQAASGTGAISSPPNHSLGIPGRNSSSPRMGQGNISQGGVPQPLSSGMVPAINTISHQIKARNPGASPEQIQRMTNEQLAAQYQHRMSQSAMNAAAGGGNNTSPQMGMMTAAGVPNQQLYAHMIRQQQANQSRAGSAGPNGARPPSRSATPQNQRGGNVQVNQGQNQSPRPPQAQMAGGQ